MSLDHIRLSNDARDQLIRLKRWTGIQNWNVLCRWAFCVSLANPERISRTKLVTDSNVEMNWKTFAGSHADLYLAALKQRLVEDGEPLHDDTIEMLFKLHLHRGIALLSSDKQVRNIAALIERAALRTLHATPAPHSDQGR